MSNVHSGSDTPDAASSGTNNDQSQSAAVSAASASEMDQTEANSGQVYWCHKCLQQIDRVTENFECSICGMGFLELVEARRSEEADDDEEEEDDETEGHGLDNQHANLMAEMLAPMLGMTLPTGANQGQGNNAAASPMQQFIQQLMSNIGGAGGGDGAQGGPLQFQITQGPNGEIRFGVQQPQLHGNPGDYAWGEGGLDTIVTQLLNQFEGGQPPLNRDFISRLPKVQVAQDTIDKSAQCTTCFDEFVLGESVVQLPCKHIFHSDCITPWLERHGTCPICRMNLVEQMGQTAATSTTTSAPAHDPATQAQMAEIDELD